MLHVKPLVARQSGIEAMVALTNPESFAIAVPLKIQTGIRRR